MRIKVPREIKMASHKYTVKFDPHMRHDEACYGQVNHRRQEINIETSVPPSTRNQTLLHEVLHIIDNVYVCGMDEGDLERLSSGLSEFFFNNLGVELDWGDIE